MNVHDIEFARRSVHYLKAQGLRSEQIRTALQSELECPPEVASQLARAA